MNMPAKLPTWGEMVQMREDKDTASLVVVYVAWGLVALSLSLGIVAFLGYQWGWPANIVIWLKTICIICWPLAGIDIIILQPTRASFICRRKEKHEAIISQKVGEITAAFKNWIIEEYANINLGEAQDHYLAHDDNGNIHHIKPGDIYEASKPLEIRFDDLEEIYPRGGADQRIDEEVRRRVFDGLEYSDGVLRAEKKHELYTVIGAQIRPNILEKYSVKHWGINFEDL